ncbi:unnamed protein product (macronuclear) [Paramecium tetraurelia]|uniref:C-CAP/cofactor C-like domain-containing protein n=1 Tax=Paramecium tetraurelia TaxID=5888 RepID=A0BQ80_PARTE|nr:uncharacterized protein GSPATT00005448001 [Paramecium tetraurelia]CAK60697.1 unnamed protein product [Paramecium tetraurelia]|eukprot:XP_001428095.1 hypothetical protein (macronuclear) [Paramecium tetraurelia strain d4-2]
MSQSAAEIRNVIKSLEKIALQLEGGTPTQQQSPQSLAELQPFKEKLNLFVEASKGLSDQSLKDITPIVTKIFSIMENAILHSTNTKKPSPDQMKQIQKAITDQVNKIAKFQTPALQYQVKAIIEGCQAAFWVTLDGPKIQVESAIESAEFNGFKLKQQKVAEVSKWYDAFIGALKWLPDFVITNYKMGLEWNGKGSLTFEQYFAALTQEKTHGAPPPPPPKGPPPPPPPQFAAPAHQTDSGDSRGALFAELNVGADITKRLKPVQKNVEKQDPLQPTTAKQQQSTQQAAAQLPKEPKRYCKENWFLENFQNEKLIEFKDDEIEMKQSLFVENCKNCGILVKAKVKSIFLQKCERVELVFDQTISGVDVVNCKKVKVTCLTKCPSLMINNSESVFMAFNADKQCEIISSKTMDLNITYLQEDGDYAKDTNIAEQFLTVWDNDSGKFITKALDISFG